MLGTAVPGTGALATLVNNAENVNYYKTVTSADSFYVLTPTTVNGVMVINPAAAEHRAATGPPSRS